MDSCSYSSQTCNTQVNPKRALDLLGIGVSSVMRVLEIEPESSGRAIGAPTSKSSPAPEEMFVSKT